MSRSTLTRDQVLESQLPAWAERESAQYFYDGLSMWRGGDTRTTVAAEDAPELGWWHQRGCSCAFCRQR